MNRLHDLLYSHYVSHYKRCNQKLFSAGGTDRKGAIVSYQIQFGDLVENLGAGSRLLDIGCGAGFLLAWLTEKTDFHLEGIDISAPMIETARELLPESVTLIQGDAISLLQTRENYFSGIFSIDIFEHIKEDDVLAKLLIAILNSLQPGGFVALRVPNMANFSSLQLRYKDATHSRGFTENSITQCLEAVGFVQIQPYGTIPNGGRQFLRRKIEDCLHWIVYRICGCAENRVFSRYLYCTARKPNHS